MVFFLFFNREIEAQRSRMICPRWPRSSAVCPEQSEGCWPGARSERAAASPLPRLPSYPDVVEWSEPSIRCSSRSLCPLAHIVARSIHGLILTIGACILTIEKSGPVLLNAEPLVFESVYDKPWFTSVEYELHGCYYKQDTTVARVPRTHLSLRTLSGSSCEKWHRC